MAAAAISSNPLPQISAQVSPSHRHGRNQNTSMSDIDAQNSSTTAAAPSTGRVGKKLDVRA